MTVTIDQQLVATCRWSCTELLVELTPVFQVAVAPGTDQQKGLIISHCLELLKDVTFPVLNNDDSGCLLQTGFSMFRDPQPLTGFFLCNRQLLIVALPIFFQRAIPQIHISYAEGKIAKG